MNSYLTAARAAVVIACAFVLSACTARTVAPDVASPRTVPAQFLAMYAAQDEERFPVPASDISEMDEQFLRTVVAYPTSEQPGTIVVDTDARHLFLVLENGQAVRYGIGVGSEGMRWSGRAQVGRKAEWPRWTPTAAMIRREPEKNGPWAKGMPPGLENPLGPRALYLYQDGRDTLYRIHGTNEPWTIGQAVSSGCIRMLNQDIIDLYRRTPVGAKVVVLNRNIDRSAQPAIAATKHPSRPPV